MGPEHRPRPRPLGIKDYDLDMDRFMTLGHLDLESVGLRDSGFTGGGLALFAGPPVPNQKFVQCNCT